MGSEADAAEMTAPLLAGVAEAVPPWREQLTVRGIVVSVVLGVLFCLITHKLSLMVGIIPSLNIGAGLLGCFLVRTWTAALERFGIVSTPFTKEENTVIQTWVVARYGLAISGGFGSYMLAMDQKTYELIGTDYPGNREMDNKNLSLSWMIGFMFLVSFLGLFSLVALRKVMVIDYKLTYPSRTATAMLINSFHTTTRVELAGFYFDFSLTYSGCGLICPHIVNCSALLGAIISWGFLWPYITTKSGDWYPADLESNDFKGLYGYKVWRRKILFVHVIMN